MNIEQLKQMGAIYLNNIQEGFNHFNYHTEKMNQEEAYQKIQQLWNQNGNEHSFADFYYFQLDKEAKRNVEAALTESEIEYLHHYPDPGEDIIFPLDKELVSIQIKLNHTAVLFSTFYFTKEPCTLWGNYNQEYVIFQKI